MNEDRVAELIARLSLEPHPEGGYYREVHRSPSGVQPLDDRPARAALTTIYFLLATGQHSRWHRVRSDEAWHFYEGDALELLVADPSAAHVSSVTLAPLDRGVPVHVVAAGWWQAARPLGRYALAGCTVAPGFDFADFSFLRDEPGAAAVLADARPDLASLL